MTLPTITQRKRVRHSRCDFCGGKGEDLQAETLVSPLGTSYQIPLSHTSCKKTVLEGSLLFTEKGATHEPKQRVRNSTRRTRRW
jgi:hypothetical protein